MNLQGVNCGTGYGAPWWAFDEVFDQHFAASEFCLAAVGLLGVSPGMEASVASNGGAGFGLGDLVGDDVHAGGFSFDGGVGV